MGFCKGGFQFFQRGKAGLFIDGKGSCRLLQVVKCRPPFIALPLAPGFLSFYVNHALYAVMVRGGFDRFFPL